MLASALILAALTGFTPRAPSPPSRYEPSTTSFRYYNSPSSSSRREHRWDNRPPPHRIEEPATYLRSWAPSLRAVPWYEWEAWSFEGWEFEGWQGVGDGGAHTRVVGPEDEVVQVDCRARLGGSQAPDHVFGCQLDFGPETSLVHLVFWSSFDGLLEGQIRVEGQIHPIEVHPYPGGVQPHFLTVGEPEFGLVSMDRDGERWVGYGAEAPLPASMLHPILMVAGSHADPRWDWPGQRLGMVDVVSAPEAQTEDEAAFVWLTEALRQLAGPLAPELEHGGDTMYRSRAAQVASGGMHLWAAARTELTFLGRIGGSTRGLSEGAVGMKGQLALESGDGIGVQLEFGALLGELNSSEDEELSSTSGFSLGVDFVTRLSYLRLSVGPRYAELQQSQFYTGYPAGVLNVSRRLGGQIGIGVHTMSPLNAGLVASFGIHTILDQQLGADSGVFDGRFVQDLEDVRAENSYGELGFTASIGIAVGMDLLVGGAPLR